MSRFPRALVQLLAFLPVVTIATAINHPHLVESRGSMSNLNATINSTNHDRANCCLTGPKQTAKICEIIDAKIPGRISFPGHALYNVSQLSYYADQERALEPSCIFRPANAAEVSQFVKLMNTDCGRGQGRKGRHARPQFAIRGGGHTLFGGAANIQGGITVDMRSMNSLVLSEDHTVTSIGSGGIWSDIYPQLVPHNLTVLGGRVPGVGVGGFLTGGGLSYQSRRYGWGCENVYGYEVVLASGEIVYATASTHSDLWLALKGGSNNFGIVTRFDVATFPQGPMWGGVITFNYTKPVLEAQAKAFSRFMDPKNFDDAADMDVILGFVNGSFGVSNALFYTDPIANPPTFQPFTSIPSPDLNNLGFRNVAEVAQDLGKNLPPRASRIIQLVYSYTTSDAALYSELIQTWEDGIKAIADVKGLLVQFLLQPQPATNGTNSMGLTPDKNNVAISALAAAYTDAVDDDVVQRGIQAIVEKHEQILRRKGLWLPFQYLNYADTSQDPIGSYGHDAKLRLKAASQKYDPTGLFQTRVPGGFKLFEKPSYQKIMYDD